jgi:hypothetical protein
MKTQRGGLKKQAKALGKTTYHSTQYNSTIVDGRQVATEKTVDIKNGKGTMTVKKMADGKVLVSTTKRISRPNIRKINNNIRVPNLFSDCIKCNTRKMAKMAKMGKMRKLGAKKN